MSLIGDALRKSRQEAAERDSDRRGVLFSAKINDSPTRSNLGLGLALGAIIAVAATVAGGGAVWWLLRQGEPTTTEQSNPVAALNPTTTEGLDTPITAPSPTPGTPVADTRALTSVGAAPVPTNHSTPDMRDSDPMTDPPPPTVETQPAADHESREMSEGFLGMEDGDEVYVLEADLGDVQLSLDFIIFRSDDSFVEINGVELHLGGIIDGFRVKSIESDRVRLSNGRRSVVLRAP